jgi:hypothetical protein
MPTAIKPKAKITSKSMRIIIDIPDVTDFDWERAHVLWKDNFKSSLMGTAARVGTNGRKLGYCWYKVNPRTNMPLTKPTGITALNNMMPVPGVTQLDTTVLNVELENTFVIFSQRLDVIENIARRLKVTGVNTTMTDRAELLNDIAALRDEIATCKEGIA